MSVKYFQNKWNLINQLQNKLVPSSKSFQKIFAILILIATVLIFKFYNKDILTRRSRTFYLDMKSGRIAEYNHSKWIILTTQKKPTNELKKLAAISDWMLLVIGDKLTPEEWSNFTSAVYLDVTKQMQLDYEIMKHLPFNSRTRKMIGYLYAIQNGALFIYDADDDVHLKNGFINFIFTPTVSGLIYDDLSRNVINPLPHFGQENLWPRGYPLELTSNKPNKSYKLCTFPTPAIQQGLVNENPDIDAICRFINKDIVKNVTFDEHSPPLTLPSEVFAPFNSQNALFTYDAFWALYLPTHVEETNIWRGYWTQKLLWLIGKNLAFIPPNAFRYKTESINNKQFEKEFKIHQESLNIIKLLSDWRCMENETFYSCVIQLSSLMSKSNIFKNNDVTLLRYWLQDLSRVGYKKPKRQSVFLHDMCLISDTNGVNWVHYSPATKNCNGYHDLLTYCNEHNPINNSLLYNEVKNHRKPSYNFNNILLVIVFNFPYLSNIRLLEILYREHFPNILFCSQGNSSENLLKAMNATKINWLNSGISFVSITNENFGYFGYECAILAIEMNYKVDGYLILGDDVLLAPWKLLPFDVAHSKIQNDSLEFHTLQSLSHCRKTNISFTQWWDHPTGKNATNNALDEIEQISQNKTDERSNLFSKFIENRIISGVNMSFIVKSYSDMYYISANHSELVAEIFKIFLKHKVFLEIAVPSVMVGSEAGYSPDINAIMGVSVWGGQRIVPFSFYNNKTVYLHPLKFNEVENDAIAKQNFCSYFVNELLNHW